MSFDPQLFTWEPPSVSVQQMTNFTGFNMSRAPNSIPGVTSLSFPLTVIQQDIYVRQAPDLVSVSFPNLTAFTGPGTSIQVDSSPLLETIDLPSLIGDVSAGHILSFSALNQINLPLFAFAGAGSGMYVYNSAALPSLDLPSLVEFNGEINISDCPSFASLNAPVLSVLGSNLTVTGAALTVPNVNALLAMLVAATTDGVTPWANAVDLSGGTSGAPSGQGILDVVTLIGRGATVTTN